MPDIQSEAFFLPGARGACLCLLHRPLRSAPIGTVLYLPPFAEEMNKARRMAALAGRALAAAGWAILLLDPFGTGDSEGEFGEATWEDWVSDAGSVHAWLEARFAGPRWVWGLRSGALLAVEALLRIGAGANLLLWQPVLSGRQLFAQFLRLKLASEMLGDAAQRSGTQVLRQQLAAGQALEVGGYMVAPALARGLEQSEFGLPPSFSGRVIWFEVASREEVSLSPLAQTRIGRLRESGVDVQAQALAGLPFWQTTEIAEVPTLVAATVAALVQATA